MEILKDLASLMSRAVETPDGEEFNRLSSVFQHHKSAIREKIQAMTSKEVKGIIKKLAEGGDLTEEEMGLVKLWIVGDAEAYAKMENKFENWIAEFKKLELLIKEQDAGAEEVQDLFRIQGILEDASRLAHQHRVLPGNERENPEIRRGDSESGPHGQGSDREDPEAEAYLPGNLTGPWRQSVEEASTRRLVGDLIETKARRDSIGHVFPQEFACNLFR